MLLFYAVFVISKLKIGINGIKNPTFLLEQLAVKGMIWALKVKLFGMI